MSELAEIIYIIILLCFAAIVASIPDNSRRYRSIDSETIATRATREERKSGK